MGKWIAGKNIGIEGLELLDYVLAGLRPYDDVGDPLPSPDSRLLDEMKKHHSCFHVGGIDGIYFGDRNYSFNGTASSTAPSYSDIMRGMIKRLNFGELETEIQSLEKRINAHKENPWIGYIPRSKLEKRVIINELLGAMYLDSDVKAMAERPSIETGIGQEGEVIFKLCREIQILLKAINKTNVAASNPKADEIWQKACMESYQANTSEFEMITEHHLSDRGLFALSTSNRPRDFVRNIWRKFEEEGLIKCTQEKLFSAFKSIR